MSRLTGNTRHRQGFRGKLILQVEERYPTGFQIFPPVYFNNYWRDATYKDLYEIERGDVHKKEMPPPPPPRKGSKLHKFWELIDIDPDE